MKNKYINKMLPTGVNVWIIWYKATWDYLFIYFINLYIGFYIPPSCANTSGCSTGSRVCWLDPFSGLLSNAKSAA